MTKFIYQLCLYIIKMYKLIKKDDLPKVTSMLNSLGYSVKSTPYSERGVYQSKLRKIQVTNTGRNTLQKAQNSRRLSNSEVNRYFMQM